MTGALVIIGGHEDRDGRRVILRAIAERLRGRPLVLATVASAAPAGYVQRYMQAFADLGVGRLAHLHITSRDDACVAEQLAMLDGAGGVFFSGGDQLRIARQIVATELETRVRAIHTGGGVIAGTSAGASAMSDTMLARGPSGAIVRLGEVRFAPGLGLLPGVIIDQHFAQRGRLGRLLGALAESEATLGLGIDEDTAIVVEGGRFTVIGSGSVTVVDGSRLKVPRVKAGERLTVEDVCLHLLASGRAFDLATRRPA